MSKTRTIHNTGGGGGGGASNEGILLPMLFLVVELFLFVVLARYLLSWLIKRVKGVLRQWLNPRPPPPPPNPYPQQQQYYEDEYY